MTSDEEFFGSSKAELKINAIKKFEEILRKPLVSEIRISDSLDEALIPNETHAQIKSLMKEIPVYNFTFSLVFFFSLIENFFLFYSIFL